MQMESGLSECLGTYDSVNEALMWGILAKNVLGAVDSSQPFFDIKGVEYHIDSWCFME